MNPLRSAYYLLAAFVLGALVSGYYLVGAMARGK